MLREALSNKTTTLNGALTNLSTKSKILDFFAVGGASRRMTDEQIIELFNCAEAEDAEAAIVLMFYFRDIISGQGERRFFRVLLKHLAKVSPEVAKALIPYVPEFGRWDDLYALVDTELESYMFSFMKKQLDEDIISERPSLLGKWLKGTRPSNIESKRLMQKTYKAFGLNPVQYRKTVSALRKKLNIVETKMCQREWDKINYSTVPSQAMSRYIKAFGKHDGERFGKYLADIENKVDGATINAKTLYPHQIIKSILDNMRYNSIFDNMRYDFNVSIKCESTRKALEALWSNLPKYALYDTLPIIDVSGSMTGFCHPHSTFLPIHASVGLGIYAAENLSGDFKNSFITFSSNPTFVEFFDDDTVTKKVQKTIRAEWNGSTDLEKVFKLILNRAIVKNVPQEEMPKKILIISDMEFNQCSSYGVTIYENAKKSFELNGYTLPQIIFWNVDAKTEQYPITKKDNALLLSGYSPVILKFLYKGEMDTPLDLVYEVVNSPRYQPIRDTLKETVKWTQQF